MYLMSIFFCRPNSWLIQINLFILQLILYFRFEKKCMLKTLILLFVQILKMLNNSFNGLNHIPRFIVVLAKIYCRLVLILHLNKGCCRHCSPQPQWAKDEVNYEFCVKLIDFLCILCENSSQHRKVICYEYKL